MDGWMDVGMTGCRYDWMYECVAIIWVHEGMDIGMHACIYVCALCAMYVFSS